MGLRRLALRFYIWLRAQRRKDERLLCSCCFRFLIYDTPLAPHHCEWLWCGDFSTRLGGAEILPGVNQGDRYLTRNTEGANNDGKTAAEWCAEWAASHSVAGCTWHIPTKDEWTQLWPAEGDFSARNTAITNAGGTRMADTYWTSTEYDDLTSEAWTLNVNYPSATFDEKWKYNTFNVRACIAF